jgi:hypothetical protein
LVAVFRRPQGDGAEATAIFPAVAAEETDEPGVLGNLPRSRPGQRSDKRASAAPKPRPAAKRAATTARKRTATRKPAAATSKRREQPAPEPVAPSPPADPITAAFRVAGKVAEVGLKTAGGILRRLPGR